ncbi:hypothetical protein [Pseudohongiella sp.]|uniref:Uncharacterized protein n=1 Tax=marine sediment metagenome TaxID=412755 RepID=A0A0F9Z644_9ZZZZ|nr:hypothetical protein [Pseudohongiella sp.]HDZ08147.1 hypothetical protein [Pseudohongiella sp.]HEA63115.1 hypothetical protein [Pseudohongiella sp.]
MWDRFYRIPVSLVALLALLLLSAVARGDEKLPPLEPSQADWIADQIFQNECNRQVSCLTSWNVGEDFPSLGIGHFIWYRQGQQERFVESFPDLLGYYVARGVNLPDWIAGLPGWASPWPDRDVFLADIDSPRMQSLRNFLNETRGIQAGYIVRRLERSLPALMAASERPDAIAAEFYRVADSEVPHGMYALIDYVNFKGEGTSVSERYQGEGWGLLQVLETMLDNPRSGTVLEQFAAAARQVLARRIENAPAERGEERWRQGWNNRTLTYVP